MVDLSLASFPVSNPEYFFVFVILPGLIFSYYLRSEFKFLKDIQNRDELKSPHYYFDLAISSTIFGIVFLFISWVLVFLSNLIFSPSAPIFGTALESTAVGLTSWMLLMATFFIIKFKKKPGLEVILLSVFVIILFLALLFGVTILLTAQYFYSPHFPIEATFSQLNCSKIDVLFSNNANYPIWIRGVYFIKDRSATWISLNSTPFVVLPLNAAISNFTGIKAVNGYIVSTSSGDFPLQVNCN